MKTCKRILVLDGEPVVRNEVRRVLGMEGYSVLETEDGLEALSLLAHHEVGLVISDMRNPILRDDRLIEQMKEVSPSSKILLLSGSPHEVAMMGLPIDGLLAKPFTFVDLRQAVGAALPG